MGLISRVSSRTYSLEIHTMTGQIKSLLPSILMIAAAFFMRDILVDKYTASAENQESKTKMDQPSSKPQTNHQPNNDFDFDEEPAYDIIDDEDMDFSSPKSKLFTKPQHLDITFKICTS